MDREFKEVIEGNGGVYLDDIAIAGNDPDELISSLEVVLKACAQAGLPMKVKEGWKRDCAERAAERSPRWTVWKYRV